MNNTIDLDEMITRLDGLAAECLSWERGTLKASNDELCILLNKCVVLYREISHSVPLKAQLTKALKDKGIPCNKSAQLHTRIVRWVFGENAQQHVYAKVIKIAAKELPEKQGFSSWLASCGGLSSVASRDSTGLDKRGRAKQQAEIGASHLWKAPTLASLPKGVACLQADDNSNSNFVAALVRRSEAGEFDLVFGTNNERLIDAMFQLAGRDVRPAIEAASVVKAARQQASDTQAAIDEAFAEVRS